MHILQISKMLIKISESAFEDLDKNAFLKQCNLKVHVKSSEIHNGFASFLVVKTHSFYFHEMQSSFASKSALFSYSFVWKRKIL